MFSTFIAVVALTSVGGVVWATVGAYIAVVFQFSSRRKGREKLKLSLDLFIGFGLAVGLHASLSIALVVALIQSEQSLSPFTALVLGMSGPVVLERAMNSATSANPSKG